MAVTASRASGQITLSNGTRTVRIHEANEGFVRQALQRFITTGGGLRAEHSAHGETLVSKGGGTDFVPKVWISSEDADGASRGSLWLTHDEAQDALGAL